MREDLALMQDAVDMHIHSEPSLFPRLLNHIDAARGAQKCGMKAVVFKCHHGFTADRVTFVRREVPGIEIFGGVVLNNAVGGLNPYAVETAIQYGAKVIWFPTISAKNHLNQMGSPDFGSSMKSRKIRTMKEKPITILDEENNLFPEVHDILDLIASHDITMATSHLSVKEIRTLIQSAKERGVKRMLVNHPEFIVNAAPEVQKELSEMGAFIEHLAIFMFPMWPIPGGIDSIVHMIKTVGPQKTVLSTDLGQIHNPPPWEGLRMFLRVLLEKGIPYGDLKRMVRDNPAFLLNL